ncbi:MAG: RtcB family protein, partial [Bacteroidia bacterium]
MNTLNIKGEDLKSIGYPEGKAIGIAIKVIEQNYAELKREDVMTILTKVVQYPENFLDDEILESIAQELIEQPGDDSTIALNETGGSYSVFGAENIQQGAMLQMDVAMKLPVTVAGALMPDAHQGYGLP